jgi:uncharacterized phage infection (PIP) family protein YhgE
MSLLQQNADNEYFVHTAASGLVDQFREWWKKPSDNNSNDAAATGDKELLQELEDTNTELENLMSINDAYVKIIDQQKTKITEIEKKNEDLSYHVNILQSEVRRLEREAVYLREAKCLQQAKSSEGKRDNSPDQMSFAEKRAEANPYYS